MSYRHAPIQSPFYLQFERYPYTRGANYVRPMFREMGPGGNFQSYPIERETTAASGLGEPTSRCPNGCPEGFPACMPAPFSRCSTQELADCIQQRMQEKSIGAVQAFHECTDPGSSLTVPGDCWNLPGFKKDSDDCFLTAQTSNQCDNGDGSYDMACVRAISDACMKPKLADCKKQLASPTPGKTGGFFDDFTTNPVKLGVTALVAVFALSWISMRKSSPAPVYRPVAVQPIRRPSPVKRRSR